MSFFKDFKDDLSLAVNELLPGEDLELEDELEDDSEMMVNTLDGELDIESELSKLDGLLEDVDKAEIGRAPEPEPEIPVREIEKSVPEPQPLPKPQPKPKAQPQPKTQQPQPKPKTQQPQPVARQAPEEKKVNPSVEALNRLNSVFDLQEDTEQEVHFSFDARMEEPEPEPMLKKAETPGNRNMPSNNKNRKTSSIIKEDVPMNEEMTNEAVVTMEEDFAAVTPEITDEVSIITTGTTIKGNLSTTGSFSISGRVEGNVQCNGKLEITGMIKGNSSSSEVFSDAAKIEGEISSTGTVKIGLGSVVVGNITATSAVIAGAVKGDIDVQGPVVVDTSAVIVGNIKSRSVQINNGAVIEGFCSQCYADIDVDSLFGENKKGK